MASRRRLEAVPTRFTVETYAAAGIAEATIYDRGVFLARIDTAEGAKRLAEILELAASLAARPDLIARGRFRVAGIVAKALGHQLDLVTVDDADG